MPRLGKPSICSAGGHVLAGAMGLALACDLVVASEDATFGTPEIQVGAFPFMVMASIYRNLPRKKVNELLLLGERITAGRGGGAGVREPGSSRRRARRGGRRLGRQAGLKSPVLLRLGKDAMYKQMDLGLGEALDFLQHSLGAGVRDRGHPGGRPGVLREARARWTSR